MRPVVDDHDFEREAQGAQVRRDSPHLMANLVLIVADGQDNGELRVLRGVM
ncbi:MAG TPA: hypothetical protein VFH73_18620 [Polyangia bacterium]|nr:hypothetical protein [Polyangia bacterium]